MKTALSAVFSVIGVLICYKSKIGKSNQIQDEWFIWSTEHVIRKQILK